MITALYAALCAALIVWLSLRVISVRREQKIRIGDGGNEALQYAIGAQANATQYIPIALIMMLTLELAGTSVWLVHAFGITLLAGRVIHGLALPAQDMKGRVLGMQITIYTLVGLAVANVVMLAGNTLAGG